MKSHWSMGKIKVTRKVFTPNEVCRLFGITRQTEWRWRKQGRLPKPIKINSKVMYRRKEIEKLLTCIIQVFLQKNDLMQVSPDICQRHPFGRKG
jgi:predicted DNA-binding transcriptional regulator AlpA